MQRKTKLYRELASCVQARLNCQKSNNQEWYCRHTETIDALVDMLPSGSGIDRGTKIDLEKSTSEKLVFNVSFHHMDENGFYDGWTEHVITVRPSLQFDIDLTISGRNRNDIKEYLHEVYSAALLDDIEFDESSQSWISSRWADYKRKTADSASV